MILEIAEGTILKPGDGVIIRLWRDATQADIEAMSVKLTKWFPDNHFVFFNEAVQIIRIPSDA